MRNTNTRASIHRSDGIAGLLRNRAAELVGLLLVAGAGICMAALATWSALDPSYNYAVETSAHNLFGRPGAVFADFLMQVFGLAAVVLILPLAIWGWRFITHRWLVRMRVRVIAWLVSPILAAGFASCIKPIANWPLTAGLGGVIGDLLLKLPVLLSGGSLSLMSRLVLAGIFGALTVTALAVAFGVGFNSDEEFDESESDETQSDGLFSRIVVSLGAITHTFLGFKARLLNPRGQGMVSLFREMFARDEELAPRGSRQEPMLRLGEHASEEEDDYEEDEAPAPRRARSATTPAPKKRRAARGRYEFPPLDLLAPAPKERAPALSASALEENSRALESVLED